MISIWYLGENFPNVQVIKYLFFTQEILKDLSENDFHCIKAEFQQVLSNRKEMTQFLEEWLNTHFDTEKLKNGIQKENDRICQVNNFYNNKIIVSNDFLLCYLILFCCLLWFFYLFLKKDLEQLNLRYAFCNLLVYTLFFYLEKIM